MMVKLIETAKEKAIREYIESLVRQEMSNTTSIGEKQKGAIWMYNKNLEQWLCSKCGGEALYKIKNRHLSTF